MSSDPRIRRYERQAELIKKLILIFLTLLILSIICLVFLYRQEPVRDISLLYDENNEEESSVAELAVTEVTETRLIPIHITGEVHRPGVYYLAPGSLVQDLIDMAGGYTGDADCDYLNLAREVESNSQIYVPAIGEVSKPAELSSSSEVYDGKININTAGKEELMKLSGVGAATADKIITFRKENGPFQDIEDIMQIPGIKEAKFLALKEDIKVE